MSICNRLSCFPANVEQQSGIIRTNNLDVISLSTRVSPHLEAHPHSHNESYWSELAWLPDQNIFIRASVQMKELSSGTSHKSGFVALNQRMHPTLILEWFMPQRVWVRGIAVSACGLFDAVRLWKGYQATRDSTWDSWVWVHGCPHIQVIDPGPGLPSSNCCWGSKDISIEGLQESFCMYEFYLDHPGWMYTMYWSLKSLGRITRECSMLQTWFNYCWLAPAFKHGRHRIVLLLL